ALVEFVPPETTTEPEPVDSYSLRLITTRKLYDQGTLVQHTPVLAGLAEPTAVRVNPYDFDRLGATTGEPVRVSSARAQFTCEVVPDAGVPRGCAAVVTGQANLPVNDLIDAGAVVNDIRAEPMAGGA